MAKLSSALRQRRFRAPSAGIEASWDGRRSLSADVEDAWLARLSTLSKPLAFVKTLVFSAVVILGDEMLAIKRFEGTAALLRVVRNASRGVVSLRRPETWVNF
jgi:hypothetical protein